MVATNPSYWRALAGGMARPKLVGLQIGDEQAWCWVADVEPPADTPLVRPDLPLKPAK